MIFDFIVFIIFVILLFYFPGKMLLVLTSWKNKSLVITTAISLSLGISLFSFFMYILSFINAHWLYLAIVIAALVVQMRYFTFPGFSVKKIFTDWKIEIVILSLGVIAMSFINWKSGRITVDGIEFYGVNSVDAIWHLSLIQNLVDTFPPTHPGLSGIPLKGYNFFYDLMHAGFMKFYNFNVFDLFFRFFTVFTAIFYALSGLSLSIFLRMEKHTRWIFLFLLFFVNDTSRFIFQLFNLSYDPGVVQTIANIVDPSVILTVGMFFTAFILIFTVKERKQFLLPSIILGVMPMIKIYTALLAIISLGVVMIVSFLRARDTRYIITFLLTGIIGAICYLPINFGAGQLVFAPLLLYKHFMESTQVIHWYKWPLKYQVFIEHNNLPRIAFLYLISIVLFFIPSLGIRLVSISMIKKIFRKDFYNLPNIFWVTAILSGIIIPTLFIQSVAVFVVLQFLWIVYFLLLIPTSYALSSIFGKINRFKLITIFVILTLLGLPGLTNLYKTYSMNPLVIKKEYMNYMNYIKENLSSSDGIIALNLVEVNGSVTDVSVLPLISSLSGHDVYYEPEVLEFLNIDEKVSERKNNIMEITTSLQNCQDETSNKLIKFMDETNNNHIFTYGTYECLENLPAFTKINASDSYSLYKLN